MDRYAVLVFHDQNITDDQQIAFTQNFGEIEMRSGGNITKPHEHRLEAGDDRRLQPRQGRQAAGARRPPPHVQSRQPAVAFGQLVPRDPGEIFDAVRRASSRPGRQHRVRRHARRLRRARRRDRAPGRGPGLRALADLLARLDGLHRADRGGAGDVQAGAPAPGAHASGDRAQVALPRPRTPARSSAGRCRRRATSCAI